MKTFRLALFRGAAAAALCALTAFFPLPGFAQASATGVVTGTVANENSRQFLNNAEVRVAGTSLTTLTDSSGSFRLANVPAGPQEILVTYAGLDSASRSVTVVPGETQRLAFALKSEIYELERFVVGGDREGQAKAINDQKNADHIKSIVASDNFGDLVDSNAAELLKSVPGFAMNYAGEDAIGFVMRGQSSVYSSIMMDGNGIPNSGFGSRSVNMRNVQVNNIESIEINRAPNASDPANSLGGSVNLVSKSAFSQQGRRIRVDVGMNINTALSHFGPSYQGFGHEAYAQFPTGQINYSDVFRADTDHPVGLSLSLLKGGRYRYNTQYTPAYSYVPALTAGQMVSTGTPAIATGATIQEASAGFRQDYYSLNLDFKVSDATTLYLRTYFQQGPQRHLFGINHRIVPFAANQTVGTGAAQTPINGNSADHIDSRPSDVPVGPGSSTGSRIQKATGHEMSENQVYNFNVGGKTRLGEVNLDYNGYFGRDFYRSPIAGLTKGGTLTYDVTNVGFTMDNLQSESQMTLNQTSGADYRKVENYGRLTWVATNTSYLDRKYGIHVNARQELNKLRFPIVLQAGAAFDIQTRENTRTGLGSRYTFGSGPDGLFGTADDVNLPLAQFVDTHMAGWNMGGFASIDPGQFIDLALLNAYVQDHPEAMTLDPVNDVIAYYGTTKTLREEIDAGYFMATIRFGKLSLIPGIRWEKTTDTGTGYVRTGQNPSTALPLDEQAAIVRAQYTPIERTVEYDDFYPNLQARYNVTNDLIVRAAYTQAIGRPNFTTILPGDTIDDVNQTIARNNVGLKPFTADNLDLTVEYYFNKSTGSVTASVFRKDIKNYFQNTSFILPGGANNGYDGLYEGYTVTEQQNIPGTTRTEGYEFGYQQGLRFLPGILKNITASASYTHVRSSPPPGSLAATGVYPDVYNLGLTYNGPKLRLDLRYNMRKSWLNAINSTTGERDYFRDNDRLDLSVNYRITPRYTAYFDWRNLLDQEDLRYVGDDQRIRFHQTAGMSINAGIRADF